MQDGDAGGHAPPPGTLDAEAVRALGFRLGETCAGPAADAYLRWIEEEARRDSLDLLLFLTPACTLLEPLLRTGAPRSAARHAQLPVTGMTGALAEVDFRTVARRLDAFAGHFEGLSAADVLLRLNVPVPAEHVMADLGLPDDRALTLQDRALLHRLLHVCRWQILRSGQAARGALMRGLDRMGVRPGIRVGLVDMGWDGSLIAILAGLLDTLFRADCVGLSFVLDAPDASPRPSNLVLKGFVGRGSKGRPSLSDLAAHRPVLDLLLSPRKAEVTGYDEDPRGTVALIWAEADPAGFGAQVIAGVTAFAAAGRSATDPLAPLAALASGDGAADRDALSAVLRAAAASRTGGAPRRLSRLPFMAPPSGAVR
ncbi:hypothetical protein EDC64_108110 [Aquabacter spiritensis]|uniref:Uncharacterized protein n=2 Tax=Aquabacter spiritensis TaxID=933073 RepID=A0A4R3LTW2_9HYPH|nr:hypothetical protein EDC64_108110 [Aquabacter spiritensis]